MSKSDRAALFAAMREYAPNNQIPANDVPVIDGIADRWGMARVASAHTLANPAAFYAEVRKITGALDQVQVNTIEALLHKGAHWPIAWLAYGLATAWHEARMKPIAEWGKGGNRPYAKPGKYGQPQYGRGLVQLTWDRNYEWADKALGLNGSLLKDFDRALEPDIASDILVKGMETGAFTGKALRDYLPTERGGFDQFRNARRIINGTDKATAIASHALAFQNALSAGGWA
ncbi:hypothetical protein [Novosphingopyxis sp. YJ-S2-01]|uniref:hypothetical protein n=1 Tax=Novosphingopyxis sp. YJ-S2-01 TaxID=2794021 RepID=UPI0018DD8BCC|nr:hypothetical protein [Novosphingopyxis sp. YJ-S2-01]MBH9537539.1 hypothetical protein [Novosphingopyxis sp. YJ-S2-01]